MDSGLNPETSTSWLVTESNKFIAYTVRNTDRGGTGLTFASTMINAIRGFLHWLFLIRYKVYDLSQKKTDHRFSFKTGGKQ
ncbi:hypothetical protein CapIbe_010634 [Capra ibex]